MTAANTASTSKPAKPAPEKKGVYLWSPEGNLPDGSCHIGLTSGATFIVPNDRAGVDVPRRFRKEAIARGCIPVGMDPETEEDTGFNRAARIRDAITQMMESTEDGMFTGAGQPNMLHLNRIAGFTAERNEVNKVWAEMQAKSGDPDDDDHSGKDNFKIGA